MSCSKVAMSSCAACYSLRYWTPSGNTSASHHLQHPWQVANICYTAHHRSINMHTCISPALMLPHWMIRTGNRQMLTTIQTTWPPWPTCAKSLHPQYTLPFKTPCHSQITISCNTPDTVVAMQAAHRRFTLRMARLIHSGRNAEQVCTTPWKSTLMSQTIDPHATAPHRAKRNGLVQYKLYLSTLSQE